MPGEPEREPPSPASASPAQAPAPLPADRREGERRGSLVERVRGGVTAQGARLARAVLVVRYVMGFLAGGFLISVPISIGSRVGYGVGLGDAVRASAVSCLYGVIFLVPFLGLIPLTRIDWREMRVPEFQLFELTVAKWAAAAAGLLFFLSLIGNPTAQPGWIEPGVLWTVFVL